MKIDRFSGADSTLPFWSSPGYRQALIIDAFKCLHQGFLEITNWRQARPFFGESLRLLIDYVTKRLPRIHGGHSEKHQAIWEILNTEPPGIAVEVGSFDGLDALAISRMFPSTKVFAFEADPRNYKRVEKNVSIREAITPISQAVFDFTGQGIFHASGGDSGASGSMLAPAAKFNEIFPHLTFEEDFSVNTTTLLDWSQQNGIDKIDLLWMDAQGAELHILQGMGDILYEVRVVLLEVGMSPYYEKAGVLDEIQDFLRDFGFYQTHIWMDGGAGDALFQKG